MTHYSVRYGAEVDRGPSDACPDCGSHRHVQFDDGTAFCACGWAGPESDLCYRVTQVEIDHALERGDAALKMLAEEIAKREREPEA